MDNIVNESSTHATTVRSPGKSSTGSSSGDTNHGDKKYGEKKQSGKSKHGDRIINNNSTCQKRAGFCKVSRGRSSNNFALLT